MDMLNATRAIFDQRKPDLTKTEPTPQLSVLPDLFTTILLQLIFQSWHFILKLNLPVCLKVYTWLFDHINKIHHTIGFFDKL